MSESIGCNCESLSKPQFGRRMSEDEIDGMGTLSRRELTESIDRLKKKLKNAERVS